MFWRRAVWRGAHKVSQNRAQPCRTPLSTLKGAHKLLMNFNRLSMSLYGTWIMAMKPGLNSNLSMTFRRKLCSTWSTWPFPCLTKWNKNESINAKFWTSCVQNILNCVDIVLTSTLDLPGPHARGTHWAPVPYLLRVTLFCGEGQETGGQTLVEDLWPVLGLLQKCSSIPSKTVLYVVPFVPVYFAEQQTVPPAGHGVPAWHWC